MHFLRYSLTYYIIFSLSQCLVPLILSDYVTMIHNLTIYEHDGSCSQCCLLSETGNTILQKLTKLAEIGGCRGDIAHRLVKSDSNVKEKLVLAIPYIITYVYHNSIIADKTCCLLTK